MPIEAHEIPRCPRLDGSTLRIVPAYTEAGQYGEANCLTVTDGERTVVYVPFAVARLRVVSADADYHLVDTGLRTDAARRTGIPRAGG
jgi:hypothetical protein